MPNPTGFCNIRFVKFAFLFSAFAALTASSLFSADIPALEAKAKQGDPAAQFELARDYLKGEGVEKNAKRAFELASSAAGKGNVESKALLGYLYLKGTGTTKDEAKAQTLLQEAADKGSAKAAYNLGIVLAGKGEMSEAVIRLNKASDAGLLEAQLLLGDWYFFGDKGIQFDYEKAFPQYLKAAKQGSAKAQNAVGYMLSSGKGTAVNPHDAMEWLLKAVAQGDIQAEANLANLYLNGEAVPTDYVEVLRLLILSSSKGNPYAKGILRQLLPGMSREDVAAAVENSGVKFKNPATLDIEDSLISPK